MTCLAHVSHDKWRKRGNKNMKKSSNLESNVFSLLLFLCPNLPPFTLPHSAGDDTFGRFWEVVVSASSWRTMWVSPLGAEIGCERWPWLGCETVASFSLVVVKLRESVLSCFSRFFVETVLCWSENVVIHFRRHVSDVADGLDEVL